MSTLLSSASPSKELIAGEGGGECKIGFFRLSLCMSSGQGVFANYLSVSYKCRILTYMAYIPLCWAIRVLAADSEIIITLCPIFSALFGWSVRAQNLLTLSLHHVPSIPYGVPSVGAYASGRCPTFYSFGYRCPSWCHSLLLSHCILPAYL
jgi:hypothetical protein